MCWPEVRGAPGPPAFVFAHTWRVAAPLSRVFAVLVDADEYAQWWPQVRSVTRLSPDHGLVRIRSLLPWTLNLGLSRTVTDPAGRLAVTISGDLTGWASWDLFADGPGTRAEYRQEVDLTAPLLASALAAPGVARLTGPVLRANHTWMMRSGERGLRRAIGCG